MQGRSAEDAGKDGECCEAPGPCPLAASNPAMLILLYALPHCTPLHLKHWVSRATTVTVSLF